MPPCTKCLVVNGMYINWTKCKHVFFYRHEFIFKLATIATASTLYTV